MMRRVIAASIFLFGIALGCRAEDVSTNALGACQMEIRAALEKGTVEYQQGLAKLAKTLQEKGELEQLLRVQEEQKRFQREGKVETTDLASDCLVLRDWQQKCLGYKSRTTRLIASNCVARLEKQKIALTKAGKIEEAVAAKEAIDLLVQTYQLDKQFAGIIKSPTVSGAVPVKPNLAVAKASAAKPIPVPEDTDRNYNEADWIKVGDWSLKKIKAAPESSSGVHEMEFDVAQYAQQTGILYMWFRYASYASPRITSVRLFVDGNMVARDEHVCNPISHRNIVYALTVPATRSNAKIVVRAQFTSADGFGNVYVRKPVTNR